MQLFLLSLIASLNGSMTVWAHKSMGRQSEAAKPGPLCHVFPIHGENPNTPASPAALPSPIPAAFSSPPIDTSFSPPPIPASSPPPPIRSRQQVGGVARGRSSGSSWRWSGQELYGRAAHLGDQEQEGGPLDGCGLSSRPTASPPALGALLPCLLAYPRASFGDVEQRADEADGTTTVAGGRRAMCTPGDSDGDGRTRPTGRRRQRADRKSVV